MATRQPRKVNAKEYRRVDLHPGCYVHVVEIVTPMRNLGEQVDLLESLRQYGAARLVEEYPVLGTFNENTEILDRRAIVPIACEE